jgi:hypothetical protein
MSEAPEILEDRGSLPASHLFTVRLWPEELEPGSTEWRGKVTYVLSGEARYFREWSDLLEFIRQTLHFKQEAIS